jgi:hypothetical protein
MNFAFPAYSQVACSTKKANDPAKDLFPVYFPQFQKEIKKKKNGAIFNARKSGGNWQGIKENKGKCDVTRCFS